MKTLLSLLCVCLFARASAQEFKVPDKIIKPEPTYYPELSPSEYKSLNPGPRFYAYVVDEWLKQPITAGHLEHKAPRYTDDEHVKLQDYIFKRMPNKYAQANAITELASFKNPNAIPLIVETMKNMQDDHLIATALQGLCHLEAKVPGKVLEPYTRSKNKAVRLAVMKLVSIQDYGKARILIQMADVESDARIQLGGIQAAAACKDKGTLKLWAKYFNGANPELFAAVLPALVTFPELARERNGLLKWCESNSPVARFALANNASKLPKLLAIDVIKKLSNDSHSSVRAATADAIAGLKLKACLPELERLSDDRYPDVRYRAVQGLVSFPQKSVFTALIKRLGDKDSDRVRVLAAKQLATIRDQYPVDQEIGKLIQSDNQDSRLNAYRVLRAINSKSHGTALRAALSSERRDTNIADCLRALVSAVGTAAEREVVSRANHESAVVRASVAELIGEIDAKAGYEILKKSSVNDSALDVRIAATLSMARINDPAFCDTYLAILKKVRPSGKEPPLTSHDRSVVCWAAAKQKTLTKQLRRRIFEHIVKAVIPQQGMPPAYDSVDVRVSATLALCTVGMRGDKESAALGEGGIDTLKMQDGGNSTMPTGPDLQSYGYQITQFVKGQPMERQQIEANKTKFSLREVVPK